MITLRGMLTKVNRHTICKVLGCHVIHELWISVAQMEVPGVKGGEALSKHGMFNKEVRTVELEEVTVGESGTRGNESSRGRFKGDAR